MTSIGAIIDKKLTKKECRMNYSDNKVEIRYYSGYATYTAKTVLKGFNGQTSILRLDRLHDVARVYVNGHDCGVVWAPPYEVDITDALKPGNNALRGNDEGTPPFDHIWTNAKYRTKSDQLLPAGLLGPVKIMFE